MSTAPGVSLTRRPEPSTKWSVIKHMARAVKDVWYGKTHRKSFARSEEILEMPYLLEIQKKSYKWFLEHGPQNSNLSCQPTLRE